MNEDNRIHEEIAAGEAWLGEVSAEPDPPNMARIMLRVQVAIDERWLAQRLEDDCPAAVANRVGVAVAEAVSSQQGRWQWRIVRWGLGLSAAAALSFAVLSPWMTSGGGDHEAYLDAFDSYVYAESKVEYELAVIEDALFDLEMDPVGGSVDGWEDSVLSGLSEDIDLLWADGES